MFATIYLVVILSFDASLSLLTCVPLLLGLGFMLWRLRIQRLQQELLLQRQVSLTSRFPRRISTHCSFRSLSLSLSLPLSFLPRPPWAISVLGLAGWRYPTASPG